MKITRRYGTSPAERGCGQNSSCPDVLRLESGDYLVIGKMPGTPNIPVKELIKHAAKIGDDEMFVIVAAEAMHAAAAEIAMEIAARDVSQVADSKER